MAVAVHSKMPQAESVHGKFYVSKLLGKAFDKVWRADAKNLAAEGADPLESTAS